MEGQGVRVCACVCGRPATRGCSNEDSMPTVCGGKTGPAVITSLY